MWRKEKAHALSVRLQKDAASMQIVQIFLNKLKIELSYDPEIPLLTIYLQKTMREYQNMVVSETFSESPLETT